MSVNRCTLNISEISFNGIIASVNVHFLLNISQDEAQSLKEGNSVFIFRVDPGYYFVVFFPSEFSDCFVQDVSAVSPALEFLENI